MNRDRVFKTTSISIIYIWLMLFAVLPLVLMLVFSFLQHDNDHLYLWDFTLDNYQTLFSWLYLRVFIRSLLLALLVTATCLLMGYPFAYFLTRLPKHYKNLMALFVIIPFWTSSLLRSYAIITIIQAQGILNTLLLKLHIIDVPLQLLYTNIAVFIGLVYNLLPFAVLPLFANMEKLDRSYLDAARDLGANGVVILTRILIPLTRSGIFSAVLLTLLPAMTLFYIPDLLGGAKSLLIGNLIEMQFLEARNWPMGAAVSVGLTLMMSILLFYYMRNTTKQERSTL